MIDTSNLEFMTELDNNIQLTVRRMTENRLDMIKDLVSEVITRESCDLASDIATELDSKYNIYQIVSEDTIYDELQGKIEDAVYENIRW